MALLPSLASQPSSHFAVLLIKKEQGPHFLSTLTSLRLNPAPPNLANRSSSVPRFRPPCVRAAKAVLDSSRTTQQRYRTLDAKLWIHIETSLLPQPTQVQGHQPLEQGLFLLCS